MSTRFLCVGDLDVDLMVSVSRLPDADDKVSGRRISLSVGGMSANVAVGLRRLGADVRLVAAVGDDEHGALAERALGREGVDIGHLVRRPGEATFMCVVMLTGSGEKSLVRLETDAYLPRPAEVPDAAFAGIGHVHLTLGSVALTRHCLERAKAAGATVSLDVERADLPDDPAILAGLLPGIDWLFMNARTRGYLEESHGGRLQHVSRGLITTEGSAGCHLSLDGVETRVPGHRVDVLDSTGAGDGLVAAFLHAHLVEGRPAVEALHRANAAAALVVQHYGAQTGLATVAEIDRFLALASPPTSHARADRHG